MLVVGETGRPAVGQAAFARLRANPRTSRGRPAAKIGDLKDAAFDDVIYFGAERRRRWPSSSRRSAAGGLFNIVQGGGKFGRPVVSQVGRVHYGGIRVIGTTGSDPAEAMAAIPATAEIRAERQDQHHRRGRPDGHDACHPRPLPGRARSDGFCRRPERRAPGRAPETGRAAGQEEQRSRCALQSVQGQTRRASSTTSS